MNDAPEAPTSLELQLKVLDAWLKLRSSTEQRTNWYYVSLFVLFGAVATGFDKLQRIGPPGRWLVVAVGITGLLGAVGVTMREVSDTKKLNALRTVVDRHGVLGNPEYETTHITSYLMILAGGVFVALMGWVACQLGPVPEAR